MQREEIVFIEDESKNQGSLAALEGGHSSDDISLFEDDRFLAVQSSIGQIPPVPLLSIPPVNTLPFLSILFVNFPFPYLCLS